MLACPDSDVFTWSEVFAEDIFDDGIHCVKPFKHPQQRALKLPSGKFRALFLRKHARVKGNEDEVEIYHTNVADLAKACSKFQYNYPHAPGAVHQCRVLSNAVTDIANAKKKCDKLHIATVRWKCGFKGCLPRWNQRFYIHSDGTESIEEELPIDLPEESTVHHHVLGQHASETRKRGARAAKGLDNTCDTSLLPEGYRPKEAGAKRLKGKPIFRLKEGFNAATANEIASGNPCASHTSYPRHRKQAGTDRREERVWVPEARWSLKNQATGHTGPTEYECMQMFEDWSREQDLAKCRALVAAGKMSKQDFGKLMTKAVFGDIQLLMRQGGGSFATLQMNRGHVKKCKMSNRKCKVLMWDATGQTILNGGLTASLLGAQQGTSGQTGLAPAPSTLCSMHAKGAPTGGARGASPKGSGFTEFTLTTIFNKFRMTSGCKWTDLCVDEDNVAMPAGRAAFGCNVHRDPVHKGRHIVKKAKMDYTKQGQQQQQSEWCHLNATLWMQFQQSQTPEQALNMKALVMEQVPENTNAGYEWRMNVFKNPMREYCEFGRLHLPAYFRTQNPVEKLFDTDKNDITPYVFVSGMDVWANEKSIIDDYNLKRIFKDQSAVRGPIAMGKALARFGKSEFAPDPKALEMCGIDVEELKRPTQREPASTWGAKRSRRRTMHGNGEPHKSSSGKGDPVLALCLEAKNVGNKEHSKVLIAQPQQLA